MFRQCRSCVDFSSSSILASRSRFLLSSFSSSDLKAACAHECTEELSWVAYNLLFANLLFPQKLLPR